MRKTRFFVLFCALLAACSETPAGPESLVPAIPENVLTSARTAEIILSWKDVSNETSYRVEYHREGSTEWLPLTETAANVTSVSHTPVEHNVKYFYRVQACNASGCSLWVETGGRWDTGAPPTLTLVRASGLADNRGTFEATGYTGGLTTTVVFTLRKKGETTAAFVSDPITATVIGASGEAGQPFTASLPYFALQGGVEYELSASASNTVGSAPAIAPYSFRAIGPAAPELKEPGTTVNGSSINLALQVNPNALATELRFEVAASGQAFAPAPGINPLSIPAGSTWVRVEVSTTLAAGSYQWRAIATNTKGSTTLQPVAFTVP